MKEDLGDLGERARGRKMKDYIIYISNSKYGHHGDAPKEEEECAPCYCGWTGIDNDGCTCNVGNE